MQFKRTRILSLALALILVTSVLLPAMTQPASALRYSGSESYMSGKYYRVLTEVSLTGDGRTDIVNIAKSQVGYQEGGSKNQLSGEVYGSLNFTEYGRWYGVQDMWCAMFVSWCANVAGISTNVVPSHSYTPNGLQWFRDRGQAYSAEEVRAGKYTPQAGDLIYFRSSRNTNRTNHVGIVTGYSNGTIYTVEGNTGTGGVVSNGGAVAARSYPITNTYIVYICSPQYSGSSTNVKAKESQADEDQLEVLRQAIYAMETGGDACYDSITQSYLGGISGQAITLGSGQWYGAEARELLLRIRSEDEAAFDRLDTAGIIEDLEQQNWDFYQISPDSEKADCIRAILSSDAGIRVQDEMMDEALRAYMQEAEDLGVTEQDAQMFCAGLRHLGGAGAVKRVLDQVQGGEYTLEAICAALNGTSQLCGSAMLYNALAE